MLYKAVKNYNGTNPPAKKGKYTIGLVTDEDSVFGTHVYNLPLIAICTYLLKNKFRSTYVCRYWYVHVRMCVCTCFKVQYMHV